MPGEKLKEHCSDKVDVRFDFNPLGMDEKTGQLSKSDDELESILWADIVLVNNISNFGGQYTARVVGKAKEAGKIVQYDTDDLLTELYEGHRLKSIYEEKGLSYIAGHLYSSSDLVTVTQAKFAHRIAPYIKGQLAVIKNSIDYNLPCWNAPKVPQPKRGKKKVVRVGWAGGIHHEQDVKQFAALPHLINGRVGKENVIWDFYGRPPKGQVKPGDFQEQVWPKYEAAFAKGFKGHRNYRIYDAMPTHEYGRMYANMDMAIAFLEDNAFNDSKSEIKVAECCAYNIPLIATDVGCYNETIKNGVTGYLLPKDNPKSEWIRVMTKVIRDHKHREELGKNLSKLYKDFFDINKVIHKRIELYDELFGKQLGVIE